MLTKVPFAEDFGLVSCALCEQPNQLRASHVIPQFAYDWLKNSSATGFFRVGWQPNRRRQDGWKPRMLCHDCEQKLGVWEKFCAEKIFTPLNSRFQGPIRYGEWFAKFATSISWRVLKSSFLDGQLDGYPSNLKEIIQDALRCWGGFLLGMRPHPGPYSQYALALDAVKDSTDSALPPNLNRYILRSIDSDVLYNSCSIFVYTKMGRLAILGILQMPSDWKWQGAKVNIGSGEFGPKRVIIPAAIGNVITSRAKKMDYWNELSDKQKKLIVETAKKDPDRAANSESLAAMAHDVRMFGNAAFLPDDSKEP